MRIGFFACKRDDEESNRIANDIKKESDRFYIYTENGSSPSIADICRSIVRDGDTIVSWNANTLAVEKVYDVLNVLIAATEINFSIKLLETKMTFRADPNNIMMLLSSSVKKLAYLGRIKMSSGRAPIIDQENLRRMLGDGMTVAEIAHEFGVSQSAVYAAMKKHDL